MKKKIILVGLISIFGLTISKTAYAKAILTDPYNDACNYVDGYKIEYNTLDYNKHYTSSSAASYNNHPKDELFGENVGKFYVNFYDKNYNLVCETDSASGYVNYKSIDYKYMTIKWQMGKTVDMPYQNLSEYTRVFPGQTLDVQYSKSCIKSTITTSNVEYELSSSISYELGVKYFEITGKSCGEISVKESKMVENSTSISFTDGLSYTYSVTNNLDYEVSYKIQMRGLYTPYIVEYFELEENTDEVYHYTGKEYIYQYIDSSKYIACSGFTSIDGKYKLLDAYKSPNYVYFD